MPMSDTNEDARLQEALAFIGDLSFDFDHVETENDGLSSVFWDEVPDETTWASPQQTAQRSETGASVHVHKWPGAYESRPSTFNRARARRREELIQLRRVVLDLEHRLTNLRANRTNHASTSRSDTKEETSEETQEIVAAWEQVAARQYKQRQQSEMENIQLRRLLEDQIQVGKSIEKILLKKRPSIESLEPSTSETKRLRLLNTHPASLTSTFDELLVRCTSQYAETDGVVARLNHKSVTVNFRDIRLVPTTSMGLTLQSTDLRILPFGYEDTVDEVWSLSPADSTVIRIHEYQDVDHTDDIAKYQLRITLTANRDHSEFNVNVAMRRYVEASRTVIVFAGMIEPSVISGVAMDGVRMRLMAWHIIEPVESRSSSHSKATKMASHFVFVPDVEEDLHDRARKVGKFTDILLSSLAVDFEHRKQHLENRLLQRLLAAE